MVPAWLRFLRRCRSVLWTAVFLVIVGLAIIVGLGRALTPYAHHLQPWLEQRLSLAVGQPVNIGSLSAEWRGLDPHLDLRDLTLGESGRLHLRQARLRFHVLHWLLPRRDDWSLEVSGLSLSLERDQNGHWQLQGFRSQGGEPADVDQLLQLGDVTLSDSQLFIVGLGEPRELSLHRVLLRQLEQGLILDGELGLAGAQPIHIKLSLDQSADQKQQIQAYVEAESQPLAAWLALVGPGWRDGADRLPRQGEAEVRLWLQGNGEDRAELTAQLKVKQGADEWRPQLWLEWRPEEWQLNLIGLDALGQTQPVQSTLDGPMPTNTTPDGGWLSWQQWRGDLGGQRVKLAGDRVDLSLVPHLVQWWPQAPEVLRQAGLSGRLRDIRGERDEDGRWHLLDARFEAIAVPVSGALPGCQQLAGAMHLEDGQGELHLSGGSLQWPRVFPEPLGVRTLALDFELHTPSAGPWSLVVPQFHWDTGAFDLYANLHYAAADPAAMDGRDWLEMNLASPGFSVTEAKGFLPLGVMGQRTGEWLQTGLLAGEMRDLRAVFQGHPGDWPFLNGEGRFHASTQVVDADIRFNHDWPTVDRLNGRLSFTPKTMMIDQARVSFAGAPVQDLSAQIADMDAAVLELQVASQSDASRHLHMLGRLPLRAGAWVEHTELSLTGPSAIDAQISIDFRDGRSDTEIAGRADFNGVGANYKDRIILDDLVGGFAFDNNGLQASILQTRWRGQPAQLGFVDDPFAVSLSGYFDIAEVLDVAGVDAQWQEYLRGRSLWHWFLAPASAGSFLQAESDLVGVQVLLPDPLSKLAPIPKRLQVSLPFADEIPVHVRYGGEVDASVRLDEAGSVAGVALALRHDCSYVIDERCPGAPQPAIGNAWIGGQGSLVDLMGWVDVIEALAGDSPSAQALDWRGNAHFDRLQLLGRYFSQARMDFSRSGEHWGVGFDGEEIRGRVRLPAGDSASNTVVAEFERLHLPVPPPSLATTPVTDPRAMPALHLYAEDLRWEEWPVGQLQVQAFPVEDGLRFETIEASNPMFSLSGQGEWLRRDDQIDSQLRLRVDAEQLGSLLDSLGYDAVVEGGQSSISLDGHWQGGPADFALSRLEGSLEVNVVQGRFLDAGAGAGRMLGLMSVQALPRRILLDFRDVFESGLNFDRLHGAFQLADGFATTDGLEIDSTAATIVITGRTDLVKREYDQTVSIRPGVGSTLPVIGAIAGGPVGATAGLALQGLLQKPLGGLTEVTYRVHGPWDNPQVDDQDEKTTDHAAPRLPELQPDRRGNKAD